MKPASNRNRAMGQAAGRATEGWPQRSETRGCERVKGHGEHRGEMDCIKSHAFVFPKPSFLFSPVLLSKKLVSGLKPIPAFSLVEVVIALGIVSFAVVAIVGMLPMALKTAKDSMFETDATLAAQRVFSELQTGSGTNRTVSTGDNSSANVSLSANSTYILAFKSDGKPIFSANSLGANPAVDFFAEILVSTNTGVSNLSQVQVNISHPAAAPPNARTTNSFTTLIGF